MWKSVWGSVTGEMHVDTGLPCQDSSAVAIVGPPGKQLAILVCSDGAGSASHALEGARQTCESVIALATAWGSSKESLPAKSDVTDWLHELRDQIAKMAAAEGLRSRDYAATVLAAVVAENEALYFQIGDGAIVELTEDRYSPVFWPQGGEYAGTTHFVTDHSFEDKLDFSVVTRRVDELALFTDGIERLTLNFAERTAHQPFFRQIFGPLRATTAPETLSKPLQAFLGSENVAKRTDDDRTLILATRLGARDVTDVL